MAAACNNKFIQHTGKGEPILVRTMANFDRRLRN